MGIGKEIKECLQVQGKTIRWLSNETGIAYSTLNSAINRDSEKMQLEHLEKISKALNVSLTDLTLLSEKWYRDFELLGIDETKTKIDYFHLVLDYLGYNAEFVDNGVILRGSGNKFVLTADEMEELIDKMILESERVFFSHFGFLDDGK